MSWHGNCLGSGADPLAETFAQIFDGSAPNYVLWSDALKGEPQPNVTPSCTSFCQMPWGLSKGALAWDESGAGFVIQVSTPDWPGSGDKTRPRRRGNTLGCTVGNNVKFSQHFLALKLLRGDVQKVLEAMQLASVVTDPSNSQLMKLTGGPPELQMLARSLGQVSSRAPASLVTLGSVEDGTADAKRVQLIAKPHGLWVPPWQMVSALLGKPLRTATYWAEPRINSTRSGLRPGCWSDELGTPDEVQVATTGQWGNAPFGLTGGGASADENAAKVAHTTLGNLVITGDLNQQGLLEPRGGTCGIAQNARGGLFFAIEDEVLHGSIALLLTGGTADFVGSSSWQHSAATASESLLV